MLERLFNPRKQQEDTVRAMKRLPPGQSLTQRFPVLHYGSVPHVDLAKWDFRVFGEVEEAKSWNWSEFNQLPRTQIMLDLHCVTRWSKFDTLWEGVAVKTLVEAGFITPKPTANYVIQHCEHGYTTNTPLDLLLAENMLMATHYDGQPLDPDHGYPLRMVIGARPGQLADKTAYLWKGGKWLRGLEFSATDKLGFWERNGYNNEADPWREMRFS
jgi:DMSO/TMAO reductase YedYZ molybdopterin-dependent catalytic subunit